MINGTLFVNSDFTGTLTSSVTFNNDAKTLEIDFSYDHNGLRTQKKVVDHSNNTTTTYDYTLHGKLITHLTKRVVDLEGVESSEELHFFYDAQSRPAFVEYEGDMYRYIHNLQGDIVAIIDPVGTPVVEYKYDAWGVPIYEASSLLSSLGNLNPFRYRGYVWDEETNQYYLGERFYYPEVARIINPDGQFDKSAGIQGFNLFAYCTNNPITFLDKDGRSIVLACTIGFGLIGAIAGGIIAGSAAKNSENENISGNWGWYALGGALLGGALGALVGWGIGKIAGAVISVASTKAPELYQSWQAAEEALRKAYNTAKTVAERTLYTNSGKRVYDALNVSKRFAYEAKYGYQSYSGNIINQIIKDTELLQNHVVKRVEWHFYTSAISNTQGFSKALENALKAAGITIVTHY